MDTEDRSEAQSVDVFERLAFGLVAITSLALIESAGQSELTFQQWRVLVVLGASADGIRVSELGRRIAASGTSTSRLVNRLQIRDLVQASPDPADRRALRLRLSPAGLALRERVLRRRRALIAEAISGRLPSSPSLAELAAIASAFDRWL